MEATTLGSWALIVAGWGIVHHFSCQRDKKKERKAFYASTRLLLEQIEESAILYHTSATRDFDLERKIKHRLQRLDMRLDLIKGKPKDKLDIIPFRQIITASNFETAKFTEHQHHDEIINSIAYQANILSEKLLSLEIT